MSLFSKKPKMNHEPTEDTCENHLETMRLNYRENPVTDKKLPKPLWLRLHRNDALNVIYQDKDIVFEQGQIYYGCLVQANQLLFDRNNRADMPANFLYSTHPFAEKYPEFLMEMAEEMFSYKDIPAEQVPEPLREVVRIITDELDRASVDFIISLPNPENPDKTIDNIDVHFCSLIVFVKDLPEYCLTGRFCPVIAAPDKSPAVFILPKEYWTLPCYDFSE